MNRGTKGASVAEEMRGIVLGIARGDISGRWVRIRLTAALRAWQMELESGADDKQDRLSPEMARAVLCADPEIRALVLRDQDDGDSVQ